MTLSIRNTLCGVALVLVGSACSAEKIPAGQSIEVRLLQVTGSAASKTGDPVEALVISPIVRNGRAMIPAGGRLQGEISTAAPLGFGFKRQTAKLGFRFHRLVLPDGSQIPIETRLRTVDSARERVDAAGIVHGIRPTTNLSSSLAVYAWRLAYLEPLVALPVWGVKFLFARAPDPEIQYPVGTELVVELTSDLDLDLDLGTPPVNARSIGPLPPDELKVAKTALDRLSHASDANGRPSDRVNVVLVAREDELKRAFEGAGWNSADRRSIRSIFRTYQAVVQRMGYSRAPVNNLQLGGQNASLVFQKSLNTFAKRHHGRVWRGPEVAGGRRIWLMAATEDVGIGFNWHRMRFVHHSDPRIENERAKIVTDLSFTHCIESAAMVRPVLADPSAQGDRVAVLSLNTCKDPFGQDIMEARSQKPPMRVAQVWKSFENELIRSNILFLSYNTTRLTTATKSLFAKRTIHSPRGTDQSEQQSEWLGSETALAFSDTSISTSTSGGEGLPD